MKVKNPFADINTYTRAVRGLKQSATDWFHSQIQRMSDSSFQRNPTYKKLEARSQKVANIVPGRMYMYAYDPKYKDTLPLYDMFPMVFPFAMTDNGFIGLNVHYLSGQNRVALMNSLVSIYTINSRRADRLSWEFLKNAALFPGAKDCVHRYLWTHVRSPFLEISQDDWVIASQLPVEKFVYRQ